MNEVKNTVLRVIDQNKDRQSEEQRKKEAYNRRAKSRQEFFAKARIMDEQISRLKVALLRSVMLDDQSNIVIDWDEETIEDLLNVPDPGPINKRKKD